MRQLIPLSVPNFEGNERKYVDDAIEQAWVSTGGAYIEQLERELSAFLHTKQTVAVQSGTAALHLCLMEAGVRPGDLVLVPPLTFIAAVNPIRYQGANPVFIDCDDSLCIDPRKLEAFCENECTLEDGRLVYRENQRTVRALVVVHVFGNMADMDAIMETARAYHLTVIEDATEALGTYYTDGALRGKYAGTIGDYGAFSFNGNKIITTGGGGAVTAGEPRALAHIRYLSTQAKDDPQYYIHHEVGYNYRMTNLQAALGVAQMEELPDFIERKKKNYDLYARLFADCNLCRLLPFREKTSSNRWFYALEIDTERVHAPMQTIIAELQEQGVQTRAVWGLISDQRPYVHETVYQLERAPHYANRVINIPCSTNITEKEIVYAADTIKQLLRKLADGI